MEGHAVSEDLLQSWGTYDRDDPFPLFARVRAEAPVRKVTLADGCRAWLVTGFEEAKAALNDPRLSKDMRAALKINAEIVAEGLPGPEFARHVLNVDPPDHARLRKLVGGAFTNRAMAELRPRAEQVCNDLLDSMEAAGPESVVDLKEAFAFPLPITIIGDMLGIPTVDRMPIGIWFDQLLSPGGDDPPAEAAAASGNIVTFLRRLVDDKRAEPRDDLVSELVAACDERNELDEQELLSMILILIVAGHDTTTNMILNGVVALLRHPDQLAALRENPGLVGGAVEEIIRYDGPGLHATFRYSVEDMQLGGTPIPKGDQVLICLAAADRDPMRFADAHSFDVARPDNRHLGFGHGIHFCLGAPLARMEGQIALTGLLRRFPVLRLALPPEELHWSHGDGIVLRGLAKLPVFLGPSA
jgi:cytochrome P450